MALKITQQVIDFHKQEKNWEPLFTSSKEHIFRYGTEEDAERLFTAFLDRPEWPGEKLLEPVRVLGGERLARRMIQECFQGNQLRENMPEDILLCLGYMHYEAAEALLWPYAAGEQGDYGHRQQACMGLLHLSCTHLKPEIEAGIKACYGKNWWNSEFLPALAYKTGKLDLLKGLYQLGSTTASTDCNGGLVLGIALYGEAGRSYFQQILWDPYWEVYASATGTLHSTMLGCSYLQISPLDLYTHLQTMCCQGQYNAKQIEHGFSLIRAMLECSGYSRQNFLTLKFLPPVTYQTQDILDQFFTSENTTGMNIISLAREYIEDKEYQVQIVDDLSMLYDTIKQLSKEEQKN